MRKSPKPKPSREAREAWRKHFAECGSCRLSIIGACPDGTPLRDKALAELEAEKK